MVKKNKEFWVNEAYKHSREVGLLRDLLDKETLECAKHKHESFFNYNMAKATMARMTRCAEMIELLVVALEQHEGHDELVKNAKIYLNIMIHGQETVTQFQDYAEWNPWEIQK